MDMCGGLAFFAIGVFIVSAVGHGIWIFGDMVLRGMIGSFRPALRRCELCGREYRGHLNECPYCPRVGVGRMEGDRLANLRTASEVLHELVQEGNLDADVALKICSTIDVKRAELRERGDIDLERARFPQVAKRISRLLGSRIALETFTPAEVERLLDAFDQLDPDTAPLSPEIVWKSAQFLKWQHRAAAAIKYYRRLFRDFASQSFIKAAALEATRFALQRSSPADARAFLDVALRCELTPQEAKHAAGLKAELDAAPPLTIEMSAPATAIPEAIVLELANPPTSTPPSPPPPPRPHAVPRRSFQEMLAGFMEEKNILWGELAGGLLIIGCSIALVISLWSTLEQIPYFPFLVFAGLTALMFGAGVYTLRHWKLEATSRGLLVIANLFVPLDFLVLAGLAKNAPWGWIDGVLSGLAILGAATLTWTAGGILLPALSDEGRRSRVPAQGWLTLGVVGAASSQLIVARWLDVIEPHLGWFLICSLMPGLLHGLASAGVTWRLGRQDTLSAKAVNHYLLFLGLTTFAVLVALGFMVYASDETLDAFRHLAIALTAAALPLIVGGAMVRQRIASTADDGARGLSAGQSRIFGTALSLTGAALALFALALGWPRPLALLVVGAVNATAFVVVARIYRLPFAHVPGLLSFAIAFVAADLGIRGLWPAEPDPPADTIIDLVLKPATAIALTLLALLLAGVSEALTRRRRDASMTESVIYLIAAAQAAFAAIALAAAPIEFRSERACGVLGVLGTAALAINLRWKRPEVGVIASMMIAACAYHGAVWALPEGSDSERFLWAMTIHSTVFLGIPAVMQRGRHERGPIWHGGYFEPLHWTGQISSSLALLALVMFTSLTTLPTAAGVSAWLLMLWIAVAILRSSTNWMRGAQALSAATALLIAAAWLARQPWAVVDGVLQWNMWCWQIYLLALAGVGLAWMAARRIADRFPAARDLLGKDVVTIDSALALTVVWLQGVLLVNGLSGPIAQEMAVPGHAALQFGVEFGVLLIIGILVPWAMFWLMRATNAYVGLIVALMVGAALFAVVFPAGEARPPLDAPWAWWTWALSAATLTLAFWQRGDRNLYAAVCALGLILAMLLALGGIETNAAASALRWTMAAIGLGGAALIWQRHQLARLTTNLRVVPPDDDIAPLCRWMLLIGSAGPVLMLTTYVALLGFGGWKPVGPNAESFFARIGWVASMTIPLSVLAATLFGHGARENRAGFIFSTGLVLLYAVAGGFALSRILADVPFDVPLQLFTVQLAVLVIAGWMLLWLASRRWRSFEFLAAQGAMALGGNALLLVLGLLVFGLNLANHLPPSFGQIGAFTGWLAWGLTIAAVGWNVSRKFRVHVVGIAVIGESLLAIWSAAPFDVRGWTSFHIALALGIGQIAALEWLSWFVQRPRSSSPEAEKASVDGSILPTLQSWLPATAAQAWVRALGVAVAIAALAGIWDDPLRPYFLLSALAVLGAIFVGLALWTQRPGDVYFSGMLAPLAGYVIAQSWIVDHSQVRELVPTNWLTLGWLLALLATSLAIASTAWSLISRRTRLPFAEADCVPFRCAAAYAGLALWAIWVLLPLANLTKISPAKLTEPFAWVASISVLVSLLVFWWEEEESSWRLPDPALFVFGLIAVVMGVEQFHTTRLDVAWWIVVLVAAYLFALNVLSLGSDRWQSLARRLGMSPRSPVIESDWWPITQSLVTLALIPGGLFFLTEESHVDRLAAFYVLAASTASSFLLTRSPAAMRWSEDSPLHAPASLALGLPQTTLVLGLAAATVFGWAWIEPSFPAPILHSSVWVFAVLLVGGGWFVSGLRGVAPVGSPWRKWAQQVGSPVLIGAILVLFAIYVQEFRVFDVDVNVRSTPLIPAAKLLMAVLLTGMAIALLLIALRRKEPIARPSPTACVWLAEGVVVLLLLHLRLNLNDLFEAVVGRRWPYVMTIASFVLVLAGEWARRCRLLMLARPWHLTGLILPVVPLVALVFRPALLSLEVFAVDFPGIDAFLRYLRPDRLSDNYWVHASLWFWYGTLWAIVGVLRRSPAAGLTAALACNFGFWVVIGNQELLTFVLHPQLWLIPLGLIVLAAEALHRSQLTPPQAAAARYFGLMLIFVSSAADLFIAGLGNSLALPIVLALLSVGAMFAGIMLRVQAFLFTGLAFLTLTVLTQIWHAAHDLNHTWVWWACGILLGVAILALFAVFEKRRLDVLRVVDEIKSWR